MIVASLLVVLLVESWHVKRLSVRLECLVSRFAEIVEARGVASCVNHDFLEAERPKIQGYSAVPVPVNILMADKVIGGGEVHVQHSLITPSKTAACSLVSEAIVDKPLRI